MEKGETTESGAGVSRETTFAICAICAICRQPCRPGRPRPYFIIRSGGSPFCEACGEPIEQEVIAEVCEACGERIEPEGRKAGGIEPADLPVTLEDVEVAVNRELERLSSFRQRSLEQIVVRVRVDASVKLSAALPIGPPHLHPRGWKLLDQTGLAQPLQIGEVQAAVSTALESLAGRPLPEHLIVVEVLGPAHQRFAVGLAGGTLAATQP